MLFSSQLDGHGTAGWNYSCLTPFAVYLWVCRWKRDGMPRKQRWLGESESIFIHVINASSNEIERCMTIICDCRIRGLPKRKAAVQMPTAPITSTSTPGQTPSFGFGKTDAPATSAPSAFSFGATPPSTTTTPATKPPVFSFGASNTKGDGDAKEEVAPAKPAFGGFSFGAPSNNSVTTSESDKSTAKSPFGGFSFGTPSKPSNESVTAASATAPPATDPSASTKPSPFSGFSFGAGSGTAGPVASSSAKLPDASVKSSEPSSGLYPPLPTSLNPITTPSAPQTVSSQPTKPASDKTPKDTEYLTNIRGLNTSLLRAFEVKLKEDPFVDMTKAMKMFQDEYEDLLNEIKLKAGKPVTKSAKVPKVKETTVDASKQPQDTPGKTGSPDTTTTAPPMAGSFKLPAPQSSAASGTTSGGFKPSAPVNGFSFGGQTVGAGNSSSSSPASVPATGGFKPTSGPTSSGFSFKPVDTAKTATAEEKKDGKQPSAASSFVQGLLAEDQNKESKSEKAPEPQAAPTSASKPAPAFSFGSPASSTGTPGKKQSAIFAIKPDVRKGADSTTSSPFSFKSPGTSATPSFNIGAGGSFNASQPAASSPSTGGFKFDAPASGKPKTTSAGFSFGSSNPSTPAANPDSSSTSKPLFSFGTSTTAPSTTPAFSFTKPTEGSSTTPAPSKPAFSFGAPPAVQTSLSGAASPFNFGTPPVSGTVTPAAVEEPSQADEPQTSLSSGAGEEDEETLWEHKAQVGELKKDDEGKHAWGDWRVCLVRLKKENKKPDQDETQPMRRLLMRVDPSGHIYQVSKCKVECLGAYEC